MKEKLLTFAIPTYNMEDFLEKCVRSCVCVNMDYLELIIVNDGSIDRSSAIGHQLEKEFPNIVRVIDKDNGNYGTCVNRALSEAKGKYFKMLDPDDWVDTESLNTLLEIMKTKDADLFYTVSEDRWLGKDLICRMAIPKAIEEGRIYDAKSFDGIAMGADYLYCSHCLTYKTELLRKIGLTLQSGISYTDNEFVFYPLDHINTIVFYNLPLYQYYVGRPGSTTVTADLKMQKQMWQVLKGMFEYFFSHYEDTPEPVRNNQRIVIAEMVLWIYSVIWGNRNTGRFTRSEQREEYLSIIEPYLKQDSVIKDRVGSMFQKARFDWYGHYCKTGKILEYTPIFDWKITMGYLEWKWIRVKMILGNICKIEAKSK